MRFGYLIAFGELAIPFDDFYFSSKFVHEAGAYFSFIAPVPIVAYNLPYYYLIRSEAGIFLT